MQQYDMQGWDNYGGLITMDWIIQNNQKYLFHKNVVTTQKDVY